MLVNGMFPRERNKTQMINQINRSNVKSRGINEKHSKRLVSFVRPLVRSSVQGESVIVSL
jgi:hypothetical protein